MIAHRGARATEPENTLRAVRKAFECGVDAVEVDVRFTADNKMVVIHDDTLDRTTNGTGRVGDRTLRELKVLDAGRGERIPELSEVISLAKLYNRSLVIELKEEGMEIPVLDAITEADMTGDVIVVSFLHHSLRNLKDTGGASIKTGAIIACVPVNPVRLVQDAEADAIFPKYERIKCNREFVDVCTDSGIEVYPWTVNTKQDLLNAIDLGVDGIATDQPCELIELMKREEGVNGGFH